MTVKDAAKFCGVHPNTIRNWLNAGMFKATRYSSRTIRIDRGELERFKNKKTK